jgi:hypothetical protein
MGTSECYIGRDGKELLKAQAARITPQTSGAVAGLPGKFPVLNCCFRIFLCKLDTADSYRRRLELLEPEHRPNLLFDSMIILFRNIVQ